MAFEPLICWAFPLSFIYSSLSPGHIIPTFFLKKKIIKEYIIGLVLAVMILLTGNFYVICQ